MMQLKLVRLCVLTLVCLACGSCMLDQTDTPSERTLAIGGLFSTTGNWSTLGKAAEAAAQLAVEDVNAYFASYGSTTRLRFQNIDTKLDPATALAAMRQHEGSQVGFFLGPQSSSELALLKPHADSTGHIIISPSSTAGSLAITDDQVLRMCPADIAEGPAIAAMMRAEGRRIFLPVWRDDIGNSGLVTATRNAMLITGAEVYDGFSYGATVTDFTPVLNQLRGILSNLLSSKSSFEIAVYVPGFDEVAEMFAAIPANDSILKSVRWYGGDGTAMSAALLPHADIITELSYPNPLFGIGDGAAIAAPIAARIKAKSGEDADAYSLSVYDAVWILARMYERMDNSWSPAVTRKQIIAEASNYFGVTGWTKMNGAGDREYGNFDLMAVRKVGGSPKWVRVGTYSASSKVYTPE